MSLMERIFGANWRTTLYGWLATISASFVASNMVWVAWLQEMFGQEWGGKIEKTMFIIAMLTGGKAFSVAKDKSVTGIGTSSEPYQKPSDSGQGSQIISPEKQP